MKQQESSHTVKVARRYLGFVGLDAIGSCTPCNAGFAAPPIERGGVADRPCWPTGVMPCWAGNRACWPTGRGVMPCWAAAILAMASLLGLPGWAALSPPVTLLVPSPVPAPPVPPPPTPAPTVLSPDAIPSSFSTAVAAVCMASRAFATPLALAAAWLAAPPNEGPFATDADAEVDAADAEVDAADAAAAFGSLQLAMAPPLSPAATAAACCGCDGPRPAPPAGFREAACGSGCGLSGGGRAGATVCSGMTAGGAGTAGGSVASFCM